MFLECFQIRHLLFLHLIQVREMCQSHGFLSFNIDFQENLLHARKTETPWKMENGKRNVLLYHSLVTQNWKRFYLAFISHGIFCSKTLLANASLEKTGKNGKKRIKVPLQNGKRVTVYAVQEWISGMVGAPSKRLVSSKVGNYTAVGLCVQGCEASVRKNNQ